MKVNLAVALVGLGLAASVTPLRAHHWVPAQYDIDREITIQGVVTRIEWTNPHARFWVDARNADGTVSNWELELPPPTALKRERGSLDFIRQGDQVTVNLWRAKDGSRLAHALTLTVPNGQVMNFSRGLGWPPDSK